MRPDLFNKKYGNKGLYESGQPENPLSGVIMIIIMFFILTSLLASNINYIKKNPNISNLQGFKFFKIKNIPMAFDIPKEVINNTLRTDKLANVLFADKKVIYYAYSDTRSDAGTYLHNLERLIVQNEAIKTNYYYYPDAQNSAAAITCQKQGVTNCFPEFLLQNCGQNACIVNGPKRQFKVISNTDAQAAYDAIVENLNW